MASIRLFVPLPNATKGKTHNANPCIGRKGGRCPPQLSDATGARRIVPGRLSGAAAGRAWRHNGLTQVKSATPMPESLSAFANNNANTPSTHPRNREPAGRFPEIPRPPGRNFPGARGILGDFLSAGSGAHRVLFPRENRPVAPLLAQDRKRAAPGILGGGINDHSPPTALVAHTSHKI